ncbi:MAG: PilX N-terminal domain-containing pilus assembly protein, partial [Planctomycetota bacterium]
MMRLKRKSSRRERSGAILIISMVFLVVFSALAVCVATLSGNSVQLASNHQDLNAALVAAQSGQEVVRYLFSRVLIPSSTPPDQYFNEIIAAVRNDMTTNGISGIGVATDGVISGVTLDSTTGRSFDGEITFDANQPTV